MLVNKLLVIILLVILILKMKKWCTNRIHTHSFKFVHLVRSQNSDLLLLLGLIMPGFENTLKNNQQSI